jgi:uncharacterized spore protein YtfJ
MEVQAIMQQIGHQVADNATVQTVFGEPVTVDGKRVIPVAKVACGFGGGGGAREAKSENETAAPQSGVGGGGGFRATPLGVVEITADSTRFIRFGGYRRMLGAFALGISLGIALRKQQRRRLPWWLEVGRALLL